MEFVECPNCGNQDEKEFTILKTSYDSLQYYISCSCGMMGPASSTEKGAVEVWNQEIWKHPT